MGRGSTSVQAGLVQPAGQREWKLSLGLGVELVVRILLGESLLVQWCKAARAKIAVKALFLLCVLWLFCLGSFHYDEILQVSQERTPKELTVPVSGCVICPKLLVHMGRAVLHYRPYLCVPLFAGQDKGWMGQGWCCARGLCVVLLLFFIFTKAWSKPFLSKILLSESSRQAPWEHDLTTVSRVLLLLSFGPDFI